MPNFTFLCVSCSPLSQIWPNYGPFMAKIWSLYGPSKYFFLNPDKCAKGFSMPSFTLLGVSCSPLSRNGQNMTPLGQNVGLTWSLKLVLPESQSMCPGMFHAKFHFSGGILQPLFLEMAKHGPFTAKTWSSQGPSNQSFLNLNYCPQLSSMPNFTLLG